MMAVKNKQVRSNRGGESPKKSGSGLGLDISNHVRVVAYMKISNYNTGDRVYDEQKLSSRY